MSKKVMVCAVGKATGHGEWGQGKYIRYMLREDKILFFQGVFVSRAKGLD
ncbi:hypothetical protein LJC46_01905 [Desulfovibrio sp. OttesenSCG-928-G15]|nr:hypothetical protein [Desulfovibrio sp. OttesenSCG-928-G15]